MGTPMPNPILAQAYQNNPIGLLQERIQKETGGGTPQYVPLNEVGKAHKKEFSMRVSLPNGLKVEGSGSTKKLAKANAARAMIDILDGRAKAINDDVRESIDLGLKALRGDSAKTAVIKASIDLGLKAMRGDTTSDPSLSEPKKIPVEELSVSFLKAKQERKAERRAARIERDNQIHQRAMERKLKKEKKLLELQNAMLDQHMINPRTWIKELIIEEVFKGIDKKAAELVPKNEQICKLCNLVFLDEKCRKKHDKGDFHDRVRQGEYPGEGGFHCYLCWVNYLQPESLLNHYSRPNHQDRARKEGVLKIWMEPVPIAPTWDTIKMFQDLRELAEDEEKMLRGMRRKRRRSGSPRDFRRDLKFSKSRDSRRDGKGRSPDPEIKAGVSGDWRAAREKTARAVDRMREQERQERKEREAKQRLKRERDERMRREWSRKMREREEMRERERQERRREREREEIYWRQKEEREWRAWKAREERRWREEREWREREDREWREQEERMWREREYLESGEMSFFDSEQYAEDETERRERRRDDSDLEEKEAEWSLKSRKKKTRDFEDELREYQAARGSRGLCDAAGTSRGSTREFSESRGSAREFSESRSSREYSETRQHREYSGSRQHREYLESRGDKRRFLGASREDGFGHSSRYGYGEEGMRRSRHYSSMPNTPDVGSDLREMLRRRRNVGKAERNRTESPESDAESISEESRSPTPKRSKKGKSKSSKHQRHRGGGGMWSDRGLDDDDEEDDEDDADENGRGGNLVKVRSAILDILDDEISSLRK